MFKNVGTVDAWIRGGLAVVFVLVAAVFNRDPGISLAAALVAFVCLGTALTRYCPIYRLFNLSTAGQRSRPHHP